MPIAPDLLEILACPECKEEVKLIRDGNALQCVKCFRIYRIEDDIPIMLLDEAEAATSMQN